MAIKAALKKWRSVASNPEWAKAPEEEKQAVRVDFFKTVVEPTLKEGELDRALMEFDFATRALKDDVFNDATFRDLDDDAKREIIGANLYANGAIEKYGSDYSGLAGRLASVNPASDKSIVEGVLRAYGAPARMQGYLAPIKGAGQLSAAGVSAIADAVAPESEYAAGARKNLADINKDINASAELKKRDASGALKAELGTNLAIGLLTGGPAQQGVKQVLGQGATRLGQFGRWLAGTAVTGGGGAALTSAEQVDPNARNQATATLSEKGKTAATGMLFQGAGDAILSSPVRKVARGAYDEARGVFAESSRLRDVGDDIIANIRAANPGASEQQILDLVRDARGNVANSTGPMFTGSKSGSLPIAQMQAGVPNTNIAEVDLKNFSSKATAPAATMAKAGENVELPQTAQYVRETYKAPAAAEFTKAKRAAVDAAKKETKEASNAMFAQAKQDGILGEAVGISKNQLKARVEDMLKDPNMQKRGVANLPSVKLLLSETDGAAQLTVDDIITYNRALLEDMNPTSGDDIKALMETVSGPLSSTQSEGAQKVWQLYRQGQDALDNHLDEIRAGFNESAAIEKSFANAPLKKALGTGASAGSVAKAATGELPPGQLAEVMKDARLAKTTKAAVAADISDTLNAEKIVDGVVSNDVSALYNKYKDSADRVREIFKDDKAFIKDFDELMQLGEASSSLKSTAGVVGGETGGKASRGITAGLGGRMTGTGTAAAGGLYDAVKDRINKKSRALLRNTIADPQKFDQLLQVTENLQKGDMSYADAYAQFQGIRGVSSAASRTAAGNNSVLENQKNYENTTQEAPASATPKGPTVKYKGVSKPEANNTTTVITPLAKQFTEAKLPPERMQYAAQVIGQESSFGKNKAGMAKSKADGPGQFFAAAKKDVEKRIGRKLNYKNEGEALVATAAYGEINRDYLKKKGIANPTDQDLYGAHFLGASGYAKLKSRIKDKVAAAGLVDREAFKGNRDYFFDKEGKYRTPAQVIQAIHNNFNKHKEAAKVYLAEK